MGGIQYGMCSKEFQNNIDLEFKKIQRNKKKEDRRAKLKIKLEKFYDELFP